MAQLVRLEDVAPGIVARFIQLNKKLLSRLSDTEQEEIKDILNHIDELKPESFVHLINAKFATPCAELLDLLHNDKVKGGKDFLEGLFGEIIKSASFIDLPVIKIFYKAAECAMEEEAERLSTYFLWFYKAHQEMQSIPKPVQ